MFNTLEQDKKINDLKIFMDYFIEYRVLHHTKQRWSGRVYTGIFTFNQIPSLSFEDYSKICISH